MNWQPIETIPDDVKLALVLNDTPYPNERIMIGERDGDGWRIHIDGQSIYPTHWMALPEPLPRSGGDDQPEWPDAPPADGALWVSTATARATGDLRTSEFRSLPAASSLQFARGRTAHDLITPWTHEAPPAQVGVEEQYKNRLFVRHLVAGEWSEPLPMEP